jgi:hypothetical protein
MALGSTQPLTEMSNRYISWGKGGQCVGLTTLPPSCADLVLKSGSLNLLEPSGPVKACNGIALPYVVVSVPRLFCCLPIFLPSNHVFHTSNQIPPYLVLPELIFRTLNRCRNMLQEILCICYVHTPLHIRLLL